MLDPLRIIHWNAQSLNRKRRMVGLFLGEQNIDLMLVPETHLRDGEIYTIPGYHIYRKDERSPEGNAYRRLAVIVKRNIIHQLIPTTQLTSNYALGILISVGGHELRLFTA